jgi:hypothetical protein
MWPAAHFFWGYSVTIVIFLFLLWIITKNVTVPDIRGFIKKRAVVGIFGGFWALIPDVNYFIDEPAFHNTQISDIFFLHYTFDTVLPETDLFFAAEVFLIFTAVNLFAVALSVETFVRLKEAMFGKEKEDDEDEDDLEEVKKDNEKGVKGEDKEDNDEGETEEGEEEKQKLKEG